MSTKKRLVKEYKKCSKDFKYFMNTYMFTDNNSESLSFLIWLVIFKSNINIGFVTSYMENGKQLINTIFRYIDNFPKEIQPKLARRTSSGFVTKDSGVNFYVMSHPVHTMGKSLTYIFVDDFDSFNKLKDRVLPALFVGSKAKNINKHIIYLM